MTGASSGIGRELARGIARRGVNVVVVARRRHELDELAAELAREYGVDVRVMVCDLTAPEARETLIAATADIDVGLVVPAAGFGSSGSFEEARIDRERAMIELNCTAVLEIVHGLLPRLLARGRGGIILMSSITAFAGAPNAVHYAATKAWTQSFAEGLHLELRHRGVSVLASAPATVATGFADEAGMSMGAAASPDVVAEATLRALGRRMTVRPGFLATALELALTLPRTMRARVMGVVMGGMARDPSATYRRFT